MIEYLLIKDADTELAVEIGGLYKLAGWWLKGPEQPEAVKNIVRNSHCFLVAKADGKVVGMGRAISDRVSDAYIQDVTVLPTWQGQGIAKTMVEMIAKHLLSTGISWIGLVAERGTADLYEKLGFKPMPNSKALLLKG